MKISKNTLRRVLEEAKVSDYGIDIIFEKILKLNTQKRALSKLTLNLYDKVSFIYNSKHRNGTVIGKTKDDEFVFVILVPVSNEIASGLILQIPTNNLRIEGINHTFSVDSLGF